MFRTLIRRMQDMRTVGTLCRDAERHANADGRQEPGVEHFILAAIELPDGTARAAFREVGADAGDFRAALARQHAEALASVGVQAPPAVAMPVPPRNGPLRAQPQVETLMRELQRQREATAPNLVGAHVIAAAATLAHGSAARALRAMGVDAAALAEAARKTARLAAQG